VFENGVYPQKIARENDDKVYLQKVYPTIGYHIFRHHLDAPLGSSIAAGAV